jgi:hypothetical protein
MIIDRLCQVIKEENEHLYDIKNRYENWQDRINWSIEVC